MIDFPPQLTGAWTLTAMRAGKVGSPKHGMRVLSTFACGGGSTMGWKLAGFDVVGAVEIDPQMAGLYSKNHTPRHLFVEPIQEFKLRPSFPPELAGLDVLDGSPPCSVFSTAGNRDRDWGKEREFREGQAKQRLDDLFFHFVDLAARLRPRVAVAENVRGLVMGKARGYVKEIFAAFDAAGYDTQLFLLDASRMGVPQTRVRTFFVARRRDLGMAPLAMRFDETPISFGAAIRDAPLPPEPRAYAQTGGRLTPAILREWRDCPPGKRLADIPRNGGKKFYSWRKIHPSMPVWTMTAAACMMHHREPRRLNRGEIVRAQSFPDDYDFLDADPTYVCGMSVPPLMMQRIALRIARALAAVDARRPAGHVAAGPSEPSVSP